MGLLSELRTLFRRKEAPPLIADGFAPTGIERPDDDEILVTITDLVASLEAAGADQESEVDEGPSERRTSRAARGRLNDFRRSLTRVDDDLWGITFAIEYTDSKGIGSTRRITLHDLYRDPRGHTFVQGICHERSALRCFRFDRIQTVIDMDGEVHEPVVFFRDELRVSIEAPIPASAPHPPPLKSRSTGAARPAGEQSGLVHRRVARDGLRLLAGLARADGLLHPSEIEVILDYIATVADRAGIATSEEDRAALHGYVKRQRPTFEIIEQCLDRMDLSPLDEQRLFLSSAVRLADADGQQDPAEFDMLMELQDRLSRQ